MQHLRRSRAVLRVPLGVLGRYKVRPLNKRYRRLRGMVRHVLPVIRRAVPTGRSLMAWKDFDGLRIRGWCRWCRLPIAKRGRRLYWDSECEWQMQSVIGHRMVPIWTPPLCESCGVPNQLEIEHRVAIHRARAIGVKALVGAFMLENIRWLCGRCHQAKTADERRAQAVQRRETLESQRIEPRHQGGLL